MMLLILLYFIVSLTNVNESRLQCKNSETGNVDWFVLYKWPKDKKSDNTFIKKGTGFSYITADTVNNGWNLSSSSINASDTPLFHVLEKMYSENQADDFLWILYNDETPNKTVSFTLGHTKGVVLANEKEGIWLVHSVPRFPPLPALNFSYPLSAVKFGQSFLCISLPSSQIDKIGEQLRYNSPQIYSSYIPTKLKDVYPNLVSVVDKSWIKSSPWNKEQEITSTGKMLFKSFAKSGKFNKDLYDWVAPALSVDLLVETWPNGRGRLPSECDHQFKVINVKSISLKNRSIAFSNHLDHSKWSIAADSNNPWVCVGDINRMLSQEERGGGTVCIKQMSLWRAYKLAVDEIESCPRD